MSSIRPFTLAIPTTKLDRLKQKLALTDFPAELTDLHETDAWSRGAPLADVQRLTKYWRDDFDWRRAEAVLNELPQFTADVDVDGFGKYRVHFVHQESTVKGAIPLLFLHGWPGTFLEVSKILPLLVQGGDGPAFHVVAPSLFDFGFSDASAKVTVMFYYGEAVLTAEQKGFHIDQHAEAYHKLMLALGYDEYVIQGGDLGSLTARIMAAAYGPRHCKAHHLNSAMPAEPTATSHPDLHARIQNTPLTPSELAGLARTAAFFQDGAGYLRQMSTKPQTLAYALTDSPAGLLAWLYEKLHTWADAYPWTDDEVLTWVSIYWFSTAGPGAAAHLYYANEHRDPGAFAASQAWVDVPLGVSRFANDSVVLPRLWNLTLGPVVFEAEHARGGHFAAWERPEAVVGDLRVMFGKGGGAAGCVAGRSGYDE